MARSPIDMNVGVSNFDAGYQLTRHLIERGYRNIGFSAPARSSGCCSNACRAGRRRCWTTTSPRRHHQHLGAAQLQHGAAMLGSSSLRWPELDALVCVNDELAPGCCSNASVAT